MAYSILRRVFLLAGIALAGCHKPYYIQSHKAQTYAVGSSTNTDSSLEQMLRPYRDNMKGQMDQVIGRADTILSRSQPECSLGDFVADAELGAAKAIDKDVVAAVANYGGLRISYLNAGPITLGRMYELMPFDNMLTIVEIPGKVLKQFCDHMAQAKGWPVSGITFVIRGGEATNIQIGGKPLSENQSYKVAVNDYMATGGDKCDFLLPLKKVNTNLFIRDVLINYVKELDKQGKALSAKIEKRVSYAE